MLITQKSHITCCDGSRKTANKYSIPIIDLDLRDGIPITVGKTPDTNLNLKSINNFEKIGCMFNN